MEIINSFTMREYFEKFDYLQLKYSPLLKHISKDDYENIVPLINKEFLNFERAKHHSLYNNINYADIKKGIKLIYISEEEANDFIFFYDVALDQLVDRFLNIQSLDKLFSHHYFEFEWQQHIDLDFDKNDLSFYRDHFIHQIRNCYMLLTLLDSTEDNNLINKIISILKTRHNELSKYACVQIEQYKEHIKSVVDSSISKINNDSLSNKLNKIKKQINENSEDYAWQYFIRGSLMVAALFHDIGYPIMFMHNRTKQLNDYLSAVLPSDSIGFDKLNNLLEESLLFTVCEKKELASRYNDFDHGALSAYVLLLQFYETGAIHSLNPIKKAIIEFAALIIYDHTLKYKISDKKYHRDKPSFAENPLSYLLRVIDDVQEWDRIYFEIRSNSDLRYCEKCKMPISRIWNSDIENCFKTDGKLNYLNHTSMKRIYACGCSDDYQGNKKLGYYAEETAIKKAIEKKLTTYHFSSGIFENGSLFAYQKINYTITAKQIYFLKNGKNDIERIYIDYDAFMQLYLLTINPKALKYRIGELAKINDQFRFQSEINLKVYAYLSDNPITLKMRILCNFLYEIGHYVNASTNYDRNPVYGEVISHEGKRLEFKYFYNIIKNLKRKGFFIYDYTDEGIEIKDFSNESGVDIINIYLEHIIKFLLREKDDNVFVVNLINVCKLYLSLALKEPITDISIKTIEDKCNELCDLKFIDKTHKDACKLLLTDALKQLYYQNEGKLDGYYVYRKNEENNDRVEHALNVVLDKRYYDPRILKEEKNLNVNKLEFFDVYSDLYLFKEMYRFSMDNYVRRTQANK